MSILSQIQQELTHAGEDKALIERLARLEERRITPEKKLPAMRFLFRMFGKPCFPRGELVGITGKAKSGKTFVSSILMTLCSCLEVLSVERIEESPLRVLWFDTEQSEESTQDILVHRIIPMVQRESASEGQSSLCEGPPGAFPLERYDIFNVRAEFWQERLPLLEAAMQKCHPDLVILDGIRDLVNDINDGVLAQDVIERLMHLASDAQCCLVCILHQNKGAEDKNLRGWIGTELLNKAFEVYECQKDADRIFSWSQSHTRKYDILDTLKFSVDDAGIPRLCSVEELLTSKNKATFDEFQSYRPAFNPKYVAFRDGRDFEIDVKGLFSDALPPGATLTSIQLQEKAMHMANITSYKFYNKLREKALAMDVIQQVSGEGGRIYYSCRVPAPTMKQMSLFPESHVLPLD